jgi:hypothetical protein
VSFVVRQASVLSYLKTDIRTEGASRLSHPFIYFPAFFVFKGFALGEADPITYAKTKYENEIIDSVKALWMVWVPCQV